jgi:hypothetical protein
MAREDAINIEQLTLLLLDDLKEVCQKLKVSAAGNKPDVVAALAAAGIQYSQLQKDQLEHLCRKQSLRVSGNKPELIDRLVRYQQQKQQKQHQEVTGAANNGKVRS